MASSTRIISAVAIAVFLLAPACRSRGENHGRRYPLTGKVVSVNPQQRQVTVAHQEIPGFMAAMTMPFTVKEDWALSVLAPGQTLSATLVVEHDRSWLEEITVQEGSSGGNPAGPGAGGAGEPQPGTAVPDFLLTNQDGGTIRLRQYRGRMLLITFVYTRCPLPDYCPRMSSNFAAIQAALRKDPALQSRVHLLSVSFDPEFDTPKVLKEYGESYIGGGADSPGFGHWEFATGTASEVRNFTTFFGLEYRKDSGQIVHTLRTALISPQGKLVRLYRGNEWTPAEVLDQIRQVAVNSGR